MIVAIVLLCAAACERVRYFGNRGAPHRELASDGELWFAGQVQDHFDDTNNGRWSQRYFENLEYFEAGGPIFLMIGGEGPESSRAVSDRFHYVQYAKELHGACVCLEHRFYGKSFPSSFDDEHLYLLSSMQALADLVTFIDWYKAENGMEASPVIAVGGSYSGNLSAWARQMYPHTFAGAIASSAPLEAIVDFSEYYEVVMDVIATKAYGGSRDCSLLHAAAKRQIMELLASEAGRRELESAFDVCGGKHIETTVNGISNFMSLINDPLAGLVQYASADTKDVAGFCDSLAGAERGEEYLKYAEFIRGYYEACIDPTFAAWIEALKNTDTSSANDGASTRSWYYQTCAEFGYYQTGPDVCAGQPSLEYFLDTCKEAFGITDVEVERTNARYGARNVAGTNIFFANGMVDPWHVLGMGEETPHPREDAVVVMRETSHCYDLYEPSATDPQSVRDTQAQELEMIKTWLE